MPPKRSADQDGDEFEPRRSKRLKGTLAATTISPDAGSLEALVAGLVKHIQTMPSNFIIPGLHAALELTLNVKLLNVPGIYNDTLGFIDAQVTSLTEATEAGQVEAQFALLAKQLITMLKTLKEMLLPPTHDAMPPPSVFGKDWVEAQEGPDAILCLRPHRRQGLPLVTLHQAFLFFVNEAKKSLSTTEVDALKAASRLSKAMANPYDSEPERRDAFNKMLDPFIPRESWLPEIVLGYEPGMSGRIDGALVDYPLLREDKGEIGSNGDPYMQIARGFQAFVKWKESQNSPQGRPGVAKFLLILYGPFLMIAGGFYDGKSTIVEPLTPSMTMLPDHDIEGRPMVIARCLTALKKAIALIHVPSENATIVPATPCIYASVISSDETEIPISFVKPLPDLGSLIFLATFTVENAIATAEGTAQTTAPVGSQAAASIESKTNCLVKLIYGRYGLEVHRLLARDGLAPGLVGVRKKEGAPTAIAMEYLKPYSHGSEGWDTLFSLAKAQKLGAADVQKGLAIAVCEVVKKLEEAGLVHGDLRANNLMIHVNADGTVLDDGKVRIKAIDFDWSGQSGEPTYPMWRNSGISWPAEIGEAIMVGHDRALVETWWGEMFHEQLYPPIR